MLQYGKSHAQMTEAEWKALPMEYWARFGPSKDELPQSEPATAYEVRPSWDPVSNAIKRTVKPNTFMLFPDEAERREAEYFRAAANNVETVRGLLADAAAEAQAIASRSPSTGSPARSRPSSARSSPTKPGFRLYKNIVYTNCF